MVRRFFGFYAFIFASAKLTENVYSSLLFNTKSSLQPVVQVEKEIVKDAVKVESEIIKDAVSSTLSIDSSFVSFWTP